MADSAEGPMTGSDDRQNSASGFLTPADRPPTPDQMRRARLKPGVKQISLALQGGGAHGAFTWGVLHRLMSDPRLYIDGISGASAGAMNGVVFADGFRRNKRQGAIDAIEAFWMRVADAAPLTPMMQWGKHLRDDWNVDQEPYFLSISLMTRLMSPYQFNAMGYHPLRKVLAESVDFDALRQRPDIQLFVSASNVRTCRSHLFRTPDLSVDALLASAALPLLFQAVEIEGEFYWDGGYLGNPAITPLIEECHSSDIVIVQLSPMNRQDVPTTAPEIINRINEMSFNASLYQQMRSLSTISTFVERGVLDEDQYTTVRFHKISAEEDLAAYGGLSSLNTDRKFLWHLHDLGFDVADRWLAENCERIGWESTLDIPDQFG